MEEPASLSIHMEKTEISPRCFYSNLLIRHRKIYMNKNAKIELVLFPQMVHL